MSIEKSKENLKQCLCIKCPSYTTGCKIKNMPKNIIEMMEGIDKQEHFEGLFCAFGKSNCIKENKNCVCPTCSITKNGHLQGGCYCIKGAVK